MPLHRCLVCCISVCTLRASTGILPCALRRLIKSTMELIHKYSHSMLVYSQSQFLYCYYHVSIQSNVAAMTVHDLFWLRVLPAPCHWMCITKESKWPLGSNVSFQHASLPLYVVCVHLLTVYLFCIKHKVNMKWLPRPKPKYRYMLMYDALYVTSWVNEKFGHSRCIQYEHCTVVDRWNKRIWWYENVNVQAPSSSFTWFFLHTESWGCEAIMKRAWQLLLSVILD